MFHLEKLAHAASALAPQGVAAAGALAPPRAASRLALAAAAAAALSVRAFLPIALDT